MLWMDLEDVSMEQLTIHALCNRHREGLKHTLDYSRSGGSITSDDVEDIKGAILRKQRS